ncbi:response regulator transcription factor [Roseomonas sp. CCTCC AB2023176]|uniref:response regulator transcription factor n=1 Tax=Roseomonas sp. CCTCC AB2023176 TaxID=3342640 RepID=UPI0035D9A5C5
MTPTVGSPIIVFDSDIAGGERVADYLAENGLPADVCGGTDPLLRRLQQQPPRLVLLHWGETTPTPALETVRQVRDVSDVPCILRARQPDSVTDRVAALESGADDWIPVEVTIREVLARIRAVLRRAGHDTAAARYDEALAQRRSSLPLPPAATRHWRLSPERRELYAPGGTPCGLTSAEFDMLHVLVQQRGAPVPRDTLSVAVFRRPWYPQDRGIDNVAARLRKKLATWSRNPQVIKPVRGIGYVFTGF